MLHMRSDGEKPHSESQAGVKNMTIVERTVGLAAALGISALAFAATLV
jgi:hypothetical protein